LHVDNIHAGIKHQSINVKQELALNTNQSM